MTVIIHINRIYFFMYNANDPRSRTATSAFARRVRCAAVSTISPHSMHLSYAATRQRTDASRDARRFHWFQDLPMYIRWETLGICVSLAFPCEVFTQHGNCFKKHSTLCFVRDWGVKLAMLKERKKLEKRKLF